MMDPETIHRNVNGGWLRPAVFGAMDGLVSNFALMIGVAGGTKAIGAENTTAIVLAGFAGLLAGAFSMAAGEYTSVASQAELAMAEIEIEKQELRDNPEIEIRELAQIIKKKSRYQGRVSWDHSKPDGTMQKLLDSSEIRNLGWEPKISLELGVADAYDWFTRSYTREGIRL